MAPARSVERMRDLVNEEAVQTVEYRLIGAMEIRVDDVPVKALGPGERALLALLLLASGRTVSASSLVDQLWSESDFPSDPLNALQVRVSKLRRTSMELGLDVVSRESTGYRLDVDPDRVDVHRFTRLIRAARDSASAGAGPDPQVLELYDDALSLWSGEPLADFAGQAWATVEVARLHQLRLSALTEAAELGLALGRPRAVVAQLGPLVGADPKQEALAGLLMTALYRSGRQVDALDVFTRTRTALDDELGLAPSAALRAVHQAVLKQDASLLRPAAAAAPARSGRRVPASEPERSAAAARAPVAGTRPLIGREAELQAVSQLLERHRVVSLVGPGGAGKTSLALVVAERLAHDFDDLVWVIRLSTVTESREVPLALADAVGVPMDGADPNEGVRGRLLSYLANRRALLVVDNCEHVVDQVARLVDEIVSRCPGITVLATSREALAIPAEVQFAVGPLAVPPDGTPTNDVLQFPAAQLFVERARAVRSGWELTSDDLHSIAVLSEQLDGMPLALELAAARTASLSVAELADRLDDRFRLLNTGPRTAETRQRTLLATVEWSHALLTEDAQKVFRRLAAFHGGWTLEGAEAVAADVDIDPGDVLDALTQLVSQSMVVSDSGRPTRFRMLETLRQYAAERLDRSGEREAVAARHAAYFRRVADDADRGLRGHGQREALRRLRQEQPNLRAALAWLSAEMARFDDALELAGALGLFWHLGRHVEGREVLGRLLPAGSGGAHARARALQAASLVERPRACLVHPSPRCAEAAKESLDLFVAEGDATNAALSRVLLAVELVDGSRPEELSDLLASAETQFTSTGEPWGHAVIAFVRLQHYLIAGDELRARATGRAAADAFRALDDPWGLSAVLYHLGWGLREFGNYAESVPLLEEAVDVAVGAGLYNTAQWALADLGLARLYVGQAEAADECFQRALEASQEIGDAAGEVLAAYGRAVQAQIGGDAGRARDLFSKAEVGFARLGTPLPRGHALAGLAWCDLEQGRPDAAGDRLEELSRLADEVTEPILAALAWEGLARVAKLQGDTSRYLRVASQAAAVRRSLNRPIPPPLRPVNDRLVDSADDHARPDVDPAGRRA